MSVQTAESPMLNQYSGELIKERQDVIGAINVERTTDRPLIEGITYDRKGTFSCEQGLSLHIEEDTVILGYHVVDASLIPLAGAFESYGYGQQSDAGKDKSMVRLFGDRILYNHLNFGDKTTIFKPTPAISFFFNVTPDGLVFDHVDKTLFQNTACLSHEDEVEVKNPHAQQIIDIVRTYTPVQGVADAEHFLSKEAATVSTDILASVGVQLFRDERNRKSINRPMRVWSDFKNLQMVSQVMDGDMPLYSADQIRNMQARARGKSKRYELDDITPHPTANLFANLLRSTDLAKRLLHKDDFITLVQHFDPENPGASNDPLLTNIFEWARKQGLFIVTDQFKSNSSIPLKFHNLDKVVEVRLSPEMSGHEIAYNGLVTYLQNTPREHDVRALKAKRMLQGFQEQALKDSFFREDEELRRFVQRNISKLIVRRSSQPRRRR